MKHVGAMLIAIWVLCGPARADDLATVWREIRLGLSKTRTIAVMGHPHLTQSVGVLGVLQYERLVWWNPRALLSGSQRHFYVVHVFHEIVVAATVCNRPDCSR